MAEYIERQALMELLQKKKYKVANERYNEGFNDAILKVRSMVHSAPAADVKEVMHGKWYRHNKKKHGDTCYYCSVCGEMALSDCMMWELTNYCPNCGAKMDLGDDEL